jgi:hypothetical protein
MKLVTKILRGILIGLTLFLFVTAFLGGIALIANFYTPPVDYLQGSIFNNFIVPGLALSLVVGGSALFAALLLIRKSKYANFFAVTAGIIIMFFEFVEILAIGSPAGPARFMQISYYALGTIIVIASMSSWFLEICRS